MTTDTEIIDQQILPVRGVPATVAPVALSLNSFGTILDLAIREHVDTGVMDRLYTLYERMKRDDAESQFNVAIQRFQAKCPPILHNQDTNRKTAPAADDKKKWGYTYADLPQIANTIRPFLDENGLSLSFTSRAQDKKFVVVCRVSHVAGHFRESEFPCDMWSSGQMNASQVVKSTMTFSQRCAMILALGITTAQTDDDGNSIVSPVDKPQADANAPKSATRAERKAGPKPHPANALFAEWQRKVMPQGNLQQFDEFCKAELETGDDMKLPQSFTAERIAKLTEILAAIPEVQSGQ